MRIRENPYAPPEAYGYLGVFLSGVPFWAVFEGNLSKTLLPGSPIFVGGSAIQKSLSHVFHLAVVLLQASHDDLFLLRDVHKYSPVD